MKNLESKYYGVENSGVEIQILELELEWQILHKASTTDLHWWKKKSTQFKIG